MYVTTDCAGDWSEVLSLALFDPPTTKFFTEDTAVFFCITIGCFCVRLWTGDAAEIITGCEAGLVLMMNC